MKLERLLQRLESQGAAAPDYAIPPRWVGGYTGPREEWRGIVRVDPYAFYTQAVRSILEAADPRANYGRSLAAQRGELDPAWMGRARIYGAFVRSATAYDHDLDGQIASAGAGGQYTETGTFLKLLAYLPKIKSFGVDTLYLLPVTKYSNAFRKGEAGSPYSVKSFTEVEPSYHDSLLGDDISAGEEFAAFVEACHILGLRVLLDFIPRTAARDNDLLLQHPDWFYWIKADSAAEYIPPAVPGLPFTQPAAGNLAQVYAQPGVHDHLARFAFDPGTTHPDEWRAFVAAHDHDADVLEQIAARFGVIVPPAFSDWINDPQPPWDDVTFLRLYRDHPAEAQPYLPDPAAQPPYILFDVAKSSLFPGHEPNEALWHFILDIIPHWQRQYGIDGARLDMGHALPRALERRLMAATAAVDPAFAFIAEELAMANDRKSKEDGYQAYVGNSWQTEYLVESGGLWELVAEELPRLVLPIMAAAEIPDSPRAVMRPGGVQWANAVSLMNYFLVNALPYINNGQEFYERQPMNLGLDHPAGSRFSLDPGDPFYGKLAFFDVTGLHWNHKDNLDALLQAAGALRAEFADLLVPAHFHFLPIKEGEAFAYFYWDSKRGLLLAVNANVAEPVTATLDLRAITWRAEHQVTQHFDNNIPVLRTFTTTNGALTLTLNGGEATIFTLGDPPAAPDADVKVITAGQPPQPTTVAGPPNKP